MDPISVLLGYLVSIAANLRTEEMLSKQRAFKQGLKVAHGVGRFTTADLLRMHTRKKLAEIAQDSEVRSGHVYTLLTDPLIEDELVSWLVKGDFEDGQEAAARFVQRLEIALINDGLDQATAKRQSQETCTIFESSLQETPELHHWRLTLYLDSLRSHMLEVQRLVRASAGTYSEEQKQNAEHEYLMSALRSWDIIDLANLPVADLHIAAQQYLLRQLYVTLRIHMEHQATAKDAKDDENRDVTTSQFSGEPPMFHDSPAGLDLSSIERRRLYLRSASAGHDEGSLAYATEPQPLPPPVPEVLRDHKRLVILGDPGSGKTTLLRWLATAYVLKKLSPSDFTCFPDAELLPDIPFLPVLIRCRDLDETSLSGSFDDFLSRSLRKLEIPIGSFDIVRTLVLDRAREGKVLILIDGLDEIPSSRTRSRFCRQLEVIAQVYQDSPILVTSRVVGYRELSGRLRSGFSHSTLADLAPSDKDTFAQRWSALVEPADQRDKRCRELVTALHSSNRIERLTGSPMLLTTLALVRRKLGRLPNRRVELYEQAIDVLLNWNQEVYDAIDRREALPQLEYVAYEMCRRATQQIREDDLLELLSRCRSDYPSLRSLLTRSCEEFLRLIEARSGILIRSGVTETMGESSWVFEFRHLTFQEFLASRALVHSHYPRQKRASSSLSDHIAALASEVKTSSRKGVEESSVAENWREAICLAVAACRDDEVDDVIMTMFNANGEGRAQAVLAGFCLADEPSVSSRTAEIVMAALLRNINEHDGSGEVLTEVDKVTIALARSEWRSETLRRLAKRFANPDLYAQLRAGVLCGMAYISTLHYMEGSDDGWDEAGMWMESEDDLLRIAANMAVAVASYLGIHFPLYRFVNTIMRGLDEDKALGYSSALALGWCAIPSEFSGRAVWVPDELQRKRLWDCLRFRADQRIASWILNILIVDPEVDILDRLDAASKGLPNSFQELFDRAKTALHTTKDRPV
jgi:hypothetical protein